MRIAMKCNRFKCFKTKSRDQKNKITSQIIQQLNFQVRTRQLFNRAYNSDEYDKKTYFSKIHMIGG